MKTFKINIHPELREIEVTVENGAEFQRCIIAGTYKPFTFTTSESDAQRIKSFAIKNGTDNSSNNGNWYAHCNGFAMDLIATQRGTNFEINTYRPFGQSKPR